MENTGNLHQRLLHVFQTVRCSAWWALRMVSTGDIHQMLLHVSQSGWCQGKDSFKACDAAEHLGAV